MPIAVRAALMLFIGVVMFAGPPLLGWGVKDAHGFVSNAARLGYLVLVVLLQLFTNICVIRGISAYYYSPSGSLWSSDHGWR